MTLFMLNKVDFIRELWDILYNNQNICKIHNHPKCVYFKKGTSEYTNQKLEELERIKGKPQLQLGISSTPQQQLIKTVG